MPLNKTSTNATVVRTPRRARTLLCKTLHSPATSPIVCLARGRHHRVLPQRTRAVRHCEHHQCEAPVGASHTHVRRTGTMMTSMVMLVLAAFLASAVEAVEAFTLVLAVGVTRGWRSTLIGAGTATLTLAAVIAAFGPALSLMPIDALRVIVGTLLLIFGLQWLRKAILRAGGYKALRDEDAYYLVERAAARAAGLTLRAGMDWYAFTLAFKGVFLEGLEVAFIVLTFGTSQGSIPLAVLGASIALVLVVGRVVVDAPLRRVPENTMKFAVGVMLATFGIFWSVEGTGIEWPGADGALLGILVVLTLVSLGLVAVLRWLHARHALHTASTAGMGA